MCDLMLFWEEAGVPLGQGMAFPPTNPLPHTGQLAGTSPER